MLFRICRVSSTVVGSTMTFWKRLSSAPSFSMEFRYSSNVVAPMHCMVPRASAGFSMLAASMEPGVEPAPMRVCISSMKMMTSGFCSISFIRARIRSSNCPRYFVPATTPVRSSVTTRLLKRIGDVRRFTMSCASPSTMALFPTPGSPMSIGLFFLRRLNISLTLCISFSRPTTGSSLPSAAAFVRSVPKLSSTGVLLLGMFACAVLAFLLLPLCRFMMGSSSSSSSAMPMPSCTGLVG